SSRPFTSQIPGIQQVLQSNFCELAGRLYFGANGGDGLELWSSDGTTAGTGTVEVTDLAPGTAPRGAATFTNSRGRPFFGAPDSTSGYELWNSDGTSSGTAILRDIYAGATSGFPRNLFNLNGTLYFSAGTAANGTELWKSDGTSSGTSLVRDINSGTSS